MKKTYSIILLAVLLCVACMKQQTPTVTAEQQRPTNTSLSTDSLVEEDSIGERRLLIALPRNASKALRNSMLEYISETLGGTFNGKVSDKKGLMRHYMDKKRQDFHDNLIELDSFITERPPYESDYTFSPLYETSKLTTLYCKGYEYWGGAHGSSLFYGQTFRNSDGRRIGWEVFHTDMNDLIRAGLKQYFNVKTDEELKDCLLTVEYLELLPMPQCPPLFTKEGVMFVYQQYEIAAYAAGMPSFTVHYDIIKKHMMQTALNLIEQ